VKENIIYEYSKMETKKGDEVEKRAAEWHVWAECKSYFLWQ
jgi:hypothetical protein